MSWKWPLVSASGKCSSAASIAARTFSGVPTPMVSATPTWSTPIARIIRATIATRDGAMSPSYGQPTAHEIAARTLTPAALAAATTGAKRSIDSAIEQLMFFWLNASLAAPKTTISSGRVAIAASQPFMLGVSTE